MQKFVAHLHSLHPHLCTQSPNFYSPRCRNAGKKVATLMIVPPPSSEQPCSSLQSWEKQFEKPQRRSENELGWEVELYQREKSMIGEGEMLRNTLQELRVNRKINIKGKRDCENIRTYARYDSLIQTLEEELAINRIYVKCIDQNLFDRFDMKSKRSLERYFFYLCVAKRQNKLTTIIPELRRKTKKKVIEKGGHRTTEFLETLINCIDCYLESAQKLDCARNIQEARDAFSHAYLYDENDASKTKRPHHNQVKGIEKCMRIFQYIFEKESNYLPGNEFVKEQSLHELVGSKDQICFTKSQELSHIKTCDNENQQNPEIYNFLKFQQGFSKKEPSFRDIELQFENFQPEILYGNDQEMKEEVGKGFQSGQASKQGHKKTTGIKNKKQDDRDIQKYAKFDIVSETSLEFCKQHKIQKLIPENIRKLSQRSLHFFFVILALIEKQMLQEQFLQHLEHDYEDKVEKRYSQRSAYFREKLKKSFRNLVESTKLLFMGNLDQALDMAYEVDSSQKTHPAKANQLKKCKEIYAQATQNLKSVFQIEKKQVGLQ